MQCEMINNKCNVTWMHLQYLKNEISCSAKYVYTNSILGNTVAIHQTSKHKMNKIYGGYILKGTSRKLIC